MPTALSTARCDTAMDSNKHRYHSNKLTATLKKARTMTRKKRDISSTLGTGTKALPPGALARVPRQAPPRMNLLSEILAWPQPPGGRSTITLLTFSPDGQRLAIA